MATLIIKTNASQLTDFTIKDLGIVVPATGGTVDQSEPSEILAARGSKKLRAALVDDAYGAGSSTLILNDGAGDIPQVDTIAYLDTLPLPTSGDYSVVARNSAGQVDVSVAFDGVATVSSLKLGNDADAGGFKLGNLGAGTVGTDAVNLNQLNSAVSAGQKWKELVLVVEQLDSVNDAISQAIAWYLDGQPAVNDTLVITDGTTTETFTFVATASVAFEVTIGANADATMDNLATVINTDSTLWSAVVATGLQELNDGSGSSTAGRVVAIYRTNQSADTFTDRIYGSFTTPALAQYVDFGGDVEYDSAISATMPSSDPTTKSFGFGRSTASLTPNEVHGIRNGDDARIWDADGLQWVSLPGPT